MSNVSFRLESFPGQSLCEIIDICRYPSPVLMTATPPLSNPIDPVSNPKKSFLQTWPASPSCPPPIGVYIRTHKPLDTSLRIWAAPPPDLTLRLWTLKTFCNCKIYQAPKTLILPRCPIMFVWVLSIDPLVSDRDLEPATGELPTTETIDTAILDEHVFLGGEQIQTTEIATDIATCLDRYLGVLPLSESRSTSSIQTTNCKGNGGSCAGKRYSKVGAARSNKGLHRRSSVSFPTVHAQFSALPVEDRLEFLSCYLRVLCLIIFVRL
ncbi:hypothetical protein N7537_011450 [Penicillium hordei]|uniref:Uncharacterized protein n=1 Tax=Penicillium hordei TaxID=40994 RepID=A0AAD6DLV5_9EURO|nr:uncharacterized protein N7537_011450 [Penicillium hordei]KAJ5588772.1 hypothetical protein N7537_011450 [Penicillium hordei]